MYTYKAEGIIIRRYNCGEADRIVTILTKQHGKIHIVAKGVRKITSRRAPALELFTHGEFLIHRDRMGKEYLSEAKSIESFETVTRDLKRIGIAFQISEVVHALTRVGHDTEDVFNLTLASLHRLNQGLTFKLSSFKATLLMILGFVEEQTVFSIELDAFIESITERKLYSVNLYEQ